MAERSRILSEVDELFGAWCDRRCIWALRELLRGYPLASGLTDEWESLREALEGVRAFGCSELTPEELDRVEKLIARIGLLLQR